MRPLTIALTLILCTTAAGAAQRGDDPFREGREVFLKELAAVDRTSSPTPQTDSEALKLYPLYPYLQAARLRRALTSADSLDSVDERAATFVTYYDREPVGRNLRRDWLSSLAGREQWQKFLEFYSAEIKDDTLRCQSFTARIATGRTENIGDDIAAAWLTPRSLPACEIAFEWLRVQNRMSPDLIEQRVRLALKDDNAAFARQLIVRLPVERTAPLLQWASLLENPARSIDALIAAPETPVDPEALLAGWTRLARTNRDAAIRRFDDLVRTRLTAETQSAYAVALAMPLAWDRRPEALVYFKRAHGPGLDDRALEWQARAALWANDWELVADSIAAMSDEQRALARWRYWAARAAEARHDTALAHQLYESVLLDDNFYSVMAASRLDRSIAPHPQKLPADRARIHEIGELPPMVRARELVRCDMRDEASGEWQLGFQALPEDARKQAIHLAARWGWYDQAISTAAQHRVFNDYELLYPQPFDKQVAASARLTGLQPDLIYAVLRQESLYRHDAVSGAGAMGLLQLLPETARRTARTWQRPLPRSEDLLDPETNIPLGAAQLRSLIDRFAGQTSVALAGTTPDPARPHDGCLNKRSKQTFWVENIPYNETRTYVQRVSWHSVVFAWLRTGEPQKAQSWLARVAPLGDAAVVGRSEDETPQ